MVINGEYPGPEGGCQFTSTIVNVNPYTAAGGNYSGVEYVGKIHPSFVPG